MPCASVNKTYIRALYKVSHEDIPILLCPEMMCTVKYIQLPEIRTTNIYTLITFLSLSKIF